MYNNSKSVLEVNKKNKNIITIKKMNLFFSYYYYLLLLNYYLLSSFIIIIYIFLYNHTLFLAFVAQSKQSASHVLVCTCNRRAIIRANLVDGSRPQN